jgi:hypothetical protein
MRKVRENDTFFNHLKMINERINGHYFINVIYRLPNIRCIQNKSTAVSGIRFFSSLSPKIRIAIAATIMRGREVTSMPENPCVNNLTMDENMFR